MKAFSKALVMMAVLSTACLAQAKEGDVSTQTITQKTGNKIILQIGQCHLSPQTDYNGQPYIESVLQYSVCEESVTYEADIVDKGWWQTETTNVRNQRNSVSVSTKSITNSNQFNSTNLNSGTSDQLTRALERVGSAALDSTRLLNECNIQREALVMQANNQNNVALKQACGQ